MGLALIALGGCASEPLTDEQREVRMKNLESLDRPEQTNNRERRQRVREPR